MLAPNQIEVPEIDQGARSLTNHEDRISAVKGVREQCHTATEGKEPEGDRDHALLPSLRGYPLDDEPHREECLAQKPD
jgi:hypothetical protein